jgi:HSP20 family protein
LLKKYRRQVMANKDKLAKTQQAEVVRRGEQEREMEYFVPAADIHETTENVVLQMDMPGVSKENVELMLDNGTLTVTGKADKEQEGKAVYRETRVGDYRRQFTIGEDFDAEHITAEMKTGVLTVKIGKVAKAKPRKIEIAGAV